MTLLEWQDCHSGRKKKDLVVQDQNGERRSFSNTWLAKVRQFTEKECTRAKVR